MRLLILSFYYEPDLSAGSFRATALVQALRERAPADTQIDVLTTVPNRYSSFRREAAEVESAPGLRVERIPLPAHRSDMLGQARAFAHYARRALTVLRSRRYDLVFATSSRLMTAVLGAWIARRQHARLYLDIRDIFADTIGDLLPSGPAALARGAFSRLEGWTVRHSDRINLVSPGFLPYFRARYGDLSFATITNGVDEEFQEAVAPREVPVEPAAAASRVTVLYAGNIGEGQGLHDIVPALAARLRDRARFVVIGDGGKRRALEHALAQAAVDNVDLMPPVPRVQLREAYRRADVLLLHLGRRPAFEKVLPSKLFEYAAVGKPVLAGVAGYAAQFIREEVRHAALFPPGDAEAAQRAFESLPLGPCPRPEFVRKYARAHLAAALADDVLALAADAVPSVNA